MKNKRLSRDLYWNRNTKTRLDRIAEKLEINEKEVIDFAISKNMKIYNLPVKGSKKDRLFVSNSNGLIIKKHFKINFSKYLNGKLKI